MAILKSTDEYTPLPDEFWEEHATAIERRMAPPFEPVEEPFILDEEPDPPPDPAQLLLDSLNAERAELFTSLTTMSDIQSLKQAILQLRELDTAFAETKLLLRKPRSQPEP